MYNESKQIMGYQNNSRPDITDPVCLVYDILFDLADVRDDMRNGISDEKLTASLLFVEETTRILAKALKKSDE